MTVHRRTIGSSGLDVLEVPSIHRDSNKKGPVIVLLHGYGASANDLLPLHQLLDPAQAATWYFPHGFVKVPLGPGIYGRAWFPIDIAALEEAVRTGKSRDLSSISPNGIDEASQKVVSMLNEIVKEREISYQDIIIGGFSQGAMLSTDICLQAEETFAKLLILSGTLLRKEKWSELIPLKAGMPFFQSHGNQDPLLPFNLAEQLYSLLCDGNWQGNFVPFAGGHEIPDQVITTLKQTIFIT